jgi:tRNA 2-selenouridine synthase
VVSQVALEDFLADKSVPILDTRAPLEYRHGHIPGAVSFPLFDDDERAVIGTLYKRKGRREAVLKGLEIVGPKLSGFVTTAEALSNDNRLRVHCWRGGMRSASMAWLLDTAGFEVAVLKGGYRAFRNSMLAAVEARNKFVVIGGYTGSRKTEVLWELEKLGQNVVDLEKLAAHKGSAFGALGQPVAPANEQFQNNALLEIWEKPNSEVIWLEDESPQIGSVWIPQPLVVKMATAPLIWLQVPLEERVQHLVHQYGKADLPGLTASFAKITKRLGGQNVQIAIDAINAGDLATAAQIALRYYDKAYLHSFARKRQVPNFSIEASLLTPLEIAQQIILWKQQNTD